MKIGYVMIRDITSSNEGHKSKLRKAGCKRIFEDSATHPKSGLYGLKDLIEFLRAGDIVVVESLKFLSLNLNAPLAVFDVLIENKCSLEIINSNKTYKPEDLAHLRIMWEELLLCRKQMITRRLDR